MASLEQAERGQGGQGRPMPVVQGVPVQPAPGVIGVRVLEPQAVPVTILDPTTQLVMSYRTAVACFAVLERSV